MSDCKAYRIFKKFFVAVICLAVLMIAGGFMFTYAYSHIEKENQTAILARYEAVDSVFYSDSEKNAESVNNIKKIAHKLPQNFVETLQETWRVVIADDLPSRLNEGAAGQSNKAALASFSQNAYIAGLCDWNSHIIFVKAESDPDDAFNIFMHELGHCFDQEFGFPSASEEFSDLYLVYKGAFHDNSKLTPAGYNTSSKEEFFATLFKEYLLDPEQLEAKAPDAFSFIDVTYKAAEGEVCASSTSAYDQEAQVAILSDYDVLGAVFYTDDIGKSEDINQMISVTSYFPNRLIDAFQEEWKVVVADQMPNGLTPYAMEVQGTVISGCADWRSRTIYVESQPDPIDTRNIFMHELGHCFDYSFGFPSASDEFYAVYSIYRDSFQEEDDRTPDGYGTSSEQEFFATIFKEYFIFPDHLKKEAPEAYMFIDSIYNEVIANEESTTTLKYDLKASLFMLKNQFKDLVD